MRTYLDLLRRVLDHGVRRSDRTGTGTLSVFGHQMRFNLAEGFPICTTKRVWFRGLAIEMLWFLSGSTNIKPLVDKRISIWTAWSLKRYLEEQGQRVPSSDSDEWLATREAFEERIRNDDGFAQKHSDLGPIYGKQWRDFGGTDQIEKVIQSLRDNPNSRRHVVAAWNPPVVSQMALPPCHLLFQFYVAEGRLSCQLYIRSNDLFLGAPFNIAQYALLTHMVAQQVDLEVGDLVYTIGDAHAYVNHLDQIREQLTRAPYALPRLVIRRRPSSILDYKYSDFCLQDYRHHPAIPAPVAV